MAKKKKSDDSGFVGNLAERGEKAVNRLLEELANNPRVTEALGRAMSAKGKANSSARKTMAQFGVAAADELKDLRKQIERLERRLARMEEAGDKPTSTAKRSETKKKPTARKKTTTTSKAQTAEKAPSPAPGRSVGGGTGRGSTPGGGSGAT